MSHASLGHIGRAKVGLLRPLRLRSLKPWQHVRDLLTLTTTYLVAMDRRERRRKRRLEKKLRQELGQERVVNERLPLSTETKLPSPQSRARRNLWQTVSRTKLLGGLVLSALTLLGGFALLRPHISVEPDLLLNPGDPFSTQFSVTNQNLILDTTGLQSRCRTIRVLTSNDVALVGLPPRPSPLIPRLRPQEKATITCPPWLGGLGAGAGNVLTAYIEIDVSYKQLFDNQERFPFKGVVDSQKGVHWTHITPEQMEAELSAQRQ